MSEGVTGEKLSSKVATVFAMQKTTNCRVERSQVLSWSWDPRLCVLRAGGNSGRKFNLRGQLSCRASKTQDGDAFVDSNSLCMPIKYVCGWGRSRLTRMWCALTRSSNKEANCRSDNPGSSRSCNILVRPCYVENVSVWHLPAHPMNVPLSSELVGTGRA